ncbi:MAG: cytochrome b/b6 domain-containing protein [Pseudomonadota bacterium]
MPRPRYSPAERPGTRLVHRHSLWTRTTHWTWAVCLFFLLLSGLQIFNAHPVLYVGEQSGFDFDNAVFRIGAEESAGTYRGVTDIFGWRIDTTGLFGFSGSSLFPDFSALPDWAIMPSGQDLATGRIIHFFFAWIFVVTLLVWLIASLANGHLMRDLIPSAQDLKALPRDIADHIRLRFHSGARYNVLQKLSYAIVLLVLMPVMIATGLAMSPGANAAFPFMTDLFGGRQTARTVHFLAMLLLVGFFVVHMAMVLAAGPVKQIRSMLTGRIRVETGKGDEA